MVDYKGAIKRPFSDFKNLSIAALMYLVPFVNFVTSMTFGTGYTLKCAKTAKKKKLPEWKDWGEIFVKGLTAFCVSFAYFLPLVVILLLHGGVPNLQTFPNVSTAFVLSPFIIVMALLLLLIFYTLPMALVHYADSFRFKDAFNFRSIFKKIFTGKYFVTWLVALLYSLLVNTVIGALSFFLAFTFVLPMILGAYMAAILGITFMTLYGQVYQELK